MSCFSCCMRSASADTVLSVTDPQKKFFDRLKCIKITAVAVAALSLVGLIASIVYAAPLGILPSLLIGGVAAICVRDVDTIRKSITDRTVEYIEKNIDSYLPSENLPSWMPKRADYVNISGFYQHWFKVLSTTKQDPSQLTDGLNLCLFRKYPDQYTEDMRKGIQKVGIAPLSAIDLENPNKESLALLNQLNDESENLWKHGFPTFPGREKPNLIRNVQESGYAYMLNYALDYPKLFPGIQEFVFRNFDPKVVAFSRTWLVGARCF